MCKVEVSAKGCGATAATSSQQRQAVAHFDVSPNQSLYEGCIPYLTIDQDNNIYVCRSYMYVDQPAITFIVNC